MAAQVLRLDFSLPAGDYTTPAEGWVEASLSSQRGFTTQRLLLRGTGTTGAATVAFYIGEEGKGPGGLTAEERARGELIPPTAAPATVDPTPSLNVTEARAGYVKPKVGSGKGQSIYMFWQSNGADVAVSVAAQLFIRME